jgi:exocyst complex component 4
VTDAQRIAAELKADMIECKESLKLKRADLGQWWARSQQHKEMIQLLDEIEALKKVPERVEQLRRRQQHAEAVTTMVDALKRIEQGPLAEIGALSELRKQLQEERHVSSAMLHWKRYSMMIRQCMNVLLKNYYKYYTLKEIKHNIKI